MFMIPSLLVLHLPVHLTRLFEVVAHLLLLVLTQSEFLQLVLTHVPLLVLLVYVALSELLQFTVNIVLLHSRFRCLRQL